MKKLIVTYINMFKAGFFYKTFIFSLLLMVPSVVKAFFNARSDIFETTFVIIIGLAILSLGLNEISEKSYIFCLSLPVQTKDIIKLAYLHTYAIYILGFLGTVLVSIFTHQELPSIYLLIIMLYLLSVNLLYPSMASPELKQKVGQQSDAGVYISLIFLGIMLFSFFSFIISYDIGHATVFYFELLEIVIVGLITAFTLKKSYKASLKKIMQQ